MVSSFLKAWTFDSSIASLKRSVLSFSKIGILIKQSSVLLKNNGKMIIEIDSNQILKLKFILRKNNFYINKISKVLSGLNRCIVCTKLNK